MNKRVCFIVFQFSGFLHVNRLLPFHWRRYTRQYNFSKCLSYVCVCSTVCVTILPLHYLQYIMKSTMNIIGYIWIYMTYILCWAYIILTVHLSVKVSVVFPCCFAHLTHTLSQLPTLFFYKSIIWSHILSDKQLLIKNNAAQWILLMSHREHSR